MSEGLLAAARSFRAALASFEPERYSGSDCLVLAEALAATEKACAGARGGR